MNIEQYRDYCIGKKGVTESFPFDESALVFKVGGKIFALADIDNFQFINLKCNPEKAIELRETFRGIKPGYHMNKVHWNSVYTASDVPDQLILDFIDQSYDSIVASLTKKLRNELSL